MEVISERAADVRVVALEGNFDTAAAHVHGKELVALADCSIVLNMKEMPFIASSGLRVLLQMARACQEKGKKLVLCHPNDVVTEILSISGFDRIIEINNAAC